jgi:hypothetical protein
MIPTGVDKRFLFARKQFHARSIGNKNTLHRNPHRLHSAFFAKKDGAAAHRPGAPESGHRTTQGKSASTKNAAARKSSVPRFPETAERKPVAALQEAACFESRRARASRQQEEAQRIQKA